MELWKGVAVFNVYHHLYLLFCQKRLHEVLQVCSVLLGSNQLTPTERVLDGHASISSYLDYGEGATQVTNCIKTICNWRQDDFFLFWP